MPLTSRTQLANLALAKIGATQLGNIDTDQTEEARQARLHFDHLRDTLLRQHPWNFGTRYVALSAIATDPLAEWDSAWQLPGDLVRLLRVTHPDDPDTPLTRFSIQGRHLHLSSTDIGEDTPVIAYVSSATPVAEYDALFVEAFALRLAAELASSIAQSPQGREAFLAEFRRLALPDAQTRDTQETGSNENSPVTAFVKRSSLRNARFSRS